MTNLYVAVKQLFPNASGNDFAIQDDGNGQYIKKWNLPNPQPTEVELQQAWDSYVPVEVLSPFEQLQKDQAELTFQLIMNGVI